MLQVEVSKNSSTALSSHDGAFVTSTTTCAPLSASASPSPVTVLTPDEGEAETASCPRSRSRGISFFPMSPLPPITTIFMLYLLVCPPEPGPLFDLRNLWPTMPKRAMRDRAWPAFTPTSYPSQG